MNNKIVYNIYHAFKNIGFATLDLISEGGKSQGSYDNGVGELTDAAAALDWLQNENPTAQNTWIAGFLLGLGLHFNSYEKTRNSWLCSSKPSCKLI